MMFQWLFEWWMMDDDVDEDDDYYSEEGDGALEKMLDDVEDRFWEEVRIK